MPFNLPYSFQYSSLPPTNQSYGWLRSAVPAWLARPGDTLLDNRFGDFLVNCERRLYYGYATDDLASPLRSQPLRIVEMEAVEPAFVLQAVVAQPPGFLELISAQLNGPNRPLEVVSQHTIDAYAGAGGSPPQRIAVAGENFRVDPDPGPAPQTATLRFYAKLPTPSGSTTNAILASYPDIYLYGCLIEASIFTQDEAAAVRYASLYNASAAGLNTRTQRITASAATVVRLRGRTP